MTFDDISHNIEEMSPEKRAKEKSRGKHKKNKKDKKKSGKALKIVFVIVLVLVIGFGAIIATGLTIVNNKVEKITKVQVDRAALGIDPRVAKELKDYRNIAFLGVDARDMQDDAGSRTDAMVIVSIHKPTNKVRLFSIYRDTYLNIGEEYGLDKAAHAYYFGGPVQALRMINRNLDLNCEEVVVTNWKAVADTVELMGGLDIEIQESEINEINKYINETRRATGGSKKKIKKAGKQTLNGVQATTYARIRKDSTAGDYRRNERMQIVVSTAFDKAKTLNFLQMNKIANTVLPEVKTNMTSSQIVEMLLKVNSYKMNKKTVGWPGQDNVLPIKHNDIWYGPPRSLNKSVIELHGKFFKQKDYNPTDTVKQISNTISQITGNW